MLIPFIIVLALLLGCQQSAETRELSLDMAAAGTSIQIAAGDAFTVTLESNITTGYSWSLLEGDESIIQVAGQEYLTPEDESGVGTGSYEVWRFTGIAPGTTNLKLGYMRPWESVAPIETFELAVTVTGSDSAGSQTTAVSSNTATSQANQTQGETMHKLTRQHNGTTQYVNIGEQVELSLPANPTTAYYWSVKNSDPVILEQVSHNYEQTGNPDNDGTGGIETWVFLAAQPGLAKLTLKRTAAGDEADCVDSFEVEIKVDHLP
ncbi:protease inhibitor I42 family protein [bacterium]|nr:protease inhibitor I42 family protein [bacterium]